MFETGIRQLRMAIGMVSGRRLNAGNLGRLAGDVVATLAEFGEPGADAQQLLDGPFADPEERAELINRSLRRTARRLAVQSPFYARRFAAAHAEPAKLDMAGLRAIPVFSTVRLLRPCRVLASNLAFSWRAILAATTR